MHFLQMRATVVIAIATKRFKYLVCHVQHNRFGHYCNGFFTGYFVLQMYERELMIILAATIARYEFLRHLLGVVFAAGISLFQNL